MAGCSMSEPDWNYLLAEQARLNGRLFYLLAYRMLRDDAAAQDVCQHAFGQAWEHRSRIVNPSARTLRSWISQTVKIECLQRLRRRKIEQRGLASRAAIQTDSVDDDPLSTERRDAVLAAIASLPETTRVIITLRYLHGMTASEIMVVVGCSSIDLWRQTREGFEALRGILSEDWRYDRD